MERSKEALVKSCLFCKIVAGELPSERIYEDELTLVIADINPVAPVHLLVLPKKHIHPLSDSPDDTITLGHMLRAAAKSAAKKGVATSDKGYRLIVNQGTDANQDVFHLHMHVLGGRNLGRL